MYPMPRGRRRGGPDADGDGSDDVYYSRRNTTKVYATCARKPRALTDLKALVESLATTVKRRRTSPVGRRPKLKVQN